MAADTAAGPPLTATRAVMLGHLVVTAPVLLIIAAVALLAQARYGAGAAGALVGAAIAWLWWALAVPRWRQWVLARGAAPAAVQRLGERTGLVWPVGSFFAKTELPPRRR